MARVAKSRGGGEVGFNMTPMIDIIFNLLIFFMLISQFEQLKIEPVTLPVARAAESKDPREYVNVVINIVKDPSSSYGGIVKIMGDVVSSDISRGIENSELAQLLIRKKETKGKRELNVILRADEDIAYEDVARVMLCAGRAGIEGWWITTTKPDKAL
ncbi:MAG: biopolymer transporter ExbD [Phycisphaerae bacterium]